jgi:putative cell wall-binding protein
MRSLTLRTAALLVAVAISVWALPGGAAAKPVVSGATVTPATVVAPDGWDPGDNTPAGAHDLTAHIPRDGGGHPRFGVAPYTEPHAIATCTATSADIDWYKLTVTAEEFEDSFLSYSIDAYSDDPSFYQRHDLVIEIYKDQPGWAATDPLSLPVGHVLDDTNPAYVTGVDDTVWIEPAPQASFSPHKSPGTSGIFYIRVRPYAAGGQYKSDETPCYYTLRIKGGQMSRLSGATRITGAIAISQEGWPSHAGYLSQNATVTLANAYNYPDALAGAPLCTSSYGPLLLTPGDHVPAAVTAEISRLGVKGVYLLGGTASISNTVRNEILAAIPGINVVRIGGANRFEAAANVSAEVRRLSGGSRRFAFIAYAYNYPDALSATPIASRNRTPILLTDTNALSPVTSAAMTAAGVTDVIVLGGTASISNAVTTQLATKLGGSDHVYRISGANRYAVAKKLAYWACDLEGPGARTGGVGTVGNPEYLGPLYYPYVGVASGEVYADALAAGPFCGNAYAPLLLTNNGDAKNYIFADYEAATPAGGSYFNGDAVLRSYLFGGNATLSDSTFWYLDYDTGFYGPGH